MLPWKRKSYRIITRVKYLVFFIVEQHKHEYLIHCHLGRVIQNIVFLTKNKTENDNKKENRGCHGNGNEKLNICIF